MGNRDIVVNKRDGGFWKLNEMNGAYDPLHYVLMFPYGESGFRLRIPLHTSHHEYSHENFDIFEKQNIPANRTEDIINELINDKNDNLEV